jgi:hypothetical protein
MFLFTEGFHGLTEQIIYTFELLGRHIKFITNTLAQKMVNVLGCYGFHSNISEKHLLIEN